MKRIEDLGISPAPWKMPSCCLSEGFVWGGDGYCICHISGKPSEAYKAMNDIARAQDPSIGYVPPSSWHDYANPTKAMADARLIAAAPDLYKALREAVIEMCHDCPSCEGSENGYRCDDPAGRCFVQKWREVLEKAAGSENPS